ncbi:MAG TPA: hypothetical protein VNG29_00225 [Candidatus Paceibacterota bacterium]|nr:hypothetical protein [Candidatus Paceibacterota bacterium]
MHLSWKEALGFVAAALTTSAYVPGFMKVWKMKPAPAIGVSFGQYACVSAGIFCWLVYGIVIGSLSVMLANILTLPITLSILWYKKKYG